MSDTPKFTVIDRRKFKGEDAENITPPEESSTESSTTPEPPISATPESAFSQNAPAGSPAAGPRLVTTAPVAVADSKSEAGHSVSETQQYENDEQEAQMPPAPTAEESAAQKISYEAAADRLNDLIRAQDPGAPRPETVTFGHLVQQLYVSALMQMGAGTPEGQRPRVDIVGARQTIDLIEVLVDKTKGNLSAEDDRLLQTVLFELRMAFLELTKMISNQPMPPAPGIIK